MPTNPRKGFFGRLLDAGRVLIGREERAIPQPSSFFWQSIGVPAQFKPEESLKAYGDNVYLYRSVLTIALEIARTKFRLRKTGRDGEYKIIQSHQALETMERPQVTKSGKSLLSGMGLKMVTSMHLLLNGEAFWLLDEKIKVNKAPARIEPLLPGYMFAKMKDGELVEYVYRLPNKEYHFDPLSIVHFKLPDPEDWTRGHSPIQSIRYAIGTHKEAEKMNAHRLENNAVPSGIITTSTGLNDQQIKSYREQWRQLYGGTGNANKVAILPQGMDFKEVQQTNQEMQFIEGQDKSRDNILSAYGVGLEILGKTESQTRSNADAAIFVFERFGVLPFVEVVNDTLNNDYLPAFPGTDEMEFWYEDLVPENMEEKRLNAQALFQIGALTPNEARKMFGMEPLNVEGMDTPYAPYSVLPVGTEPVAPNIP